MCLTSHPGRYDAESQTLITGTLCNNGKAAGSATQQDAENGFLVTHTLRGEGHDASEDGTGRGTPLVPVSFNMHKSGNNGSSLGVAEDRTDCLRAFEKSPFAVHVPQSAVRRLTPRECERLQGFPDDWTAITHRGKPAADGPRYKALGNSMAVPVLRWIGDRIAKQEASAC